MTVAGESKACTRAATWSLRRASSCSSEDKQDRVEAREGGTEMSRRDSTWEKASVSTSLGR
eukprot:3165653-Pleurochrysis_carterae.AAC.1